MFVTRLQGSRKQQATTAIPYAEAAPFVEPTSPQFSEGGFVTRRQRSRRHQWSSFLNQFPQPVTEAEAPWPSFAGVSTNRFGFDRSLLRPPQLDEFPVSEGADVPIGGITPVPRLRRKARTGLFLTAADYIEASVVQPVPATVIIALAERRRRRRKIQRKRFEPVEIAYVEALPPAGEEYETAWRAVYALRRVDIARSLRRLLEPVIPQEHSPGWKLAEALYRRDTSRTLQRLPTLSFFKSPLFEDPSHRPWPTLKRRDVSRRTHLPLIPPDHTVAAPPAIGAEGFPAFIPPSVYFRPARRAPQFLPVFIPRATAVAEPGLQPPHYVIGVMDEHGAGLRGPMTVHAVTVNGRIAPTHAVNGSFDPSEGHGGSVL